MNNKELHNDVQLLKTILTSRATGGVSSDFDYVNLRARLIKSPLKDKLPDFINYCRTLDEFWGHIKQEFGTYQERRNYLRDQFHNILFFLENQSDTVMDETNTFFEEEVTFEYIQNTWKKALSRKEEDPEGAITTARSLLESVCKHILEESGVTVDEKWEMPKLYKETQLILNLSPDGYTEQIFKQILSGCSSIVNGVASLRNKLSDAHGRGTNVIVPDKKHAKMTVNLSGTIAEFLLTTWEEQNKK
ncbi:MULTISPECIES: abortive infection family protein [Metabacillus]|uniref:abortive infection family protein n=1 Tax=Metabacillus TaxID=2675233 RepID=UPI000C7FC177|nr:MULTISPECIES: abortive infection family protein [Metabacillus]MCM3443277.1 abortive infection family protein [Metabacillus halosaccharovorans]PMC34210.1 abortive phage resistance protein [Bacillus sp. UMB0899]